MKLLISTFSLLLVITLHCFSQSHSSLGLSIGTAIPVGEFAKTDSKDDKSGLAKLGALANLTYTLPFEESDFGFAASLRARWNPINTEAALGGLREAYPGFQWESNKASWKSAALMVGVYRDFHFIKNVLINTTALLGASESELPQYKVTGVANSANFPGTLDAVFATSNKKYATAFSGSFQAGASGNLSKRLYWLARGDFWYTRPVFKNVTQTAVYAQGLVVTGSISAQNASIISSSTNTQNYTQPSNSINLSIGLGLKL